MHAGKVFPGFLKSVFHKRFKSEMFVVLDIGTFGAKALYIEGKGETGEVTAYANKQYVGGDINPDGSFNVSGIINTCRSALDELKQSSFNLKKGGHFTKKTVIGIGGGFVYGKTLTQSYIREQPHIEIDEAEFTNIIQKVQQRNYEQIRRDFKRDTGRSELGVHLLSGSLQEIKIDGYQIVNPVGFKGKEVTCSLFNSYMPKVYLEIFIDLIKTLNLELISIISQPYAVFSDSLKRNSEESDFILIDIGGSSTEISIVRKGKLDDIRSISVGGSSFTKSIAENLKIGFWEAENIKQKFSEKHVSSNVAKKIESIIAQDIELLLHGLEIVLSDLSQVTLLPGIIYIYGGGASMLQIIKSLKQDRWRENLSFVSKPQVAILAPIGTIVAPSDIQKSNWTVPLSMASMHIAQRRGEDERTKILKRSLRLIQG